MSLRDTLPNGRTVATPDEVAAYWQCSANYVRNLIKKGELEAFKLGECLIRIPVSSVEAQLRKWRDA